VLGVTPQTKKTYDIKLCWKKLVKMHLHDLFSKFLDKSKLHILMDAPLRQYFDVRDVLSQAGVKITEKAPIKRICLLEKGEEIIKEIDADVAFTKLLALNRSEFSYYHNKLFLAYDYFNKAFSLNHLMDKETEILKCLVERSDCMVLRTEDAERYSKLLDEVS